MLKHVFIVVLVISLFCACLPPVPVVAFDLSMFSIDVWTNKAGRGSMAHGGNYLVGEEVMLYVMASNNCQVEWSVTGPSLTKSGSLTMEGGKEYVWQMGILKPYDIGQWLVNFEATIPGKYAKDTVVFQVTSNAPSQPAQEPASAVPKTVTETETSVIEQDNAIELAALIALHMSEGSLQPDLLFDADGDGVVGSTDADTILAWSVSPYGSDFPTSDQLEIIDLFGEPSQFIVSYVLSEDTEMDFLVRVETWYYPQYNSQVTFVAGDRFEATNLEFEEMEYSSSSLRPWDFDCFMNYDQVMRQLAAAGKGRLFQKISSKDADHLDFMPEFLEEQGFSAYLGETAFFLMENDELAYIQVFGGESSGFVHNLQNPGSGTDIGDGWLGISLTNPFNPQPTYARISFKKFGRWMGRNVKKVARAIHRVPQKASLIFPKKIRPVVIAIVETKMGNLRAWQIAAKVNNVAALEQGLKKLRDTYNKQASTIEASAQQLREEQKTLESELPSGLNMSASEWRTRYDLVKEVAASLEDISSRLRNKANNTSLGDVTRIGLQQLAKKTLRNIEKAVMQHIGDELKNRIGEGKLNAFIRTGEGQVSVDRVIDLFVSGRIARILKEMGADDDFRHKVENAVKDELKQGRTEIRDLDKLIEKTIARIRKEGTALTEQAGKEQKKVDGEEDTIEIDLSVFNTLSFYVLIDNVVFNDNSSGSWSIRGDLLQGEFSGNTFTGTRTFTNDKGCKVQQGVEAVFDDDFNTLTSLYIEYLTDCPERGGIKASTIESSLEAKNIDVRSIDKRSIWCYTSNPAGQLHDTGISYTRQYGTSTPEYMTGFGCKQQCWIDIKIEAK